jgi:hypothetical protein
MRQALRIGVGEPPVVAARPAAARQFRFDCQTAMKVRVRILAA